VIGGRADQRGSRSGIEALDWEAMMAWSLDWASFGGRAAIVRRGSTRVTSVDSGAIAVVTEYGILRARSGVKVRSGTYISAQLFGLCREIASSLLVIAQLSHPNLHDLVPTSGAVVLYFSSLGLTLSQQFATEAGLGSAEYFAGVCALNINIKHRRNRIRENVVIWYGRLPKPYEVSKANGL
jgi:hypothetical protein